MPGARFRSAFTRPDVTPADVLKFHRSIFGDTRMSNDDSANNGGDAGNTDGTGSGSDGGSGDDKTLEDVIAELGLTPEQIKARLEASRKWEQRAKSSDRVDRSDYDRVRTELEELKRANETEHEKAVREAREQGKTEALSSAANETVAAMLRMGLRARGIDGDDLEEAVSTINLAAHANENGAIDDEKVLRTINRLAGTAGTSAGPDTGQGHRGGQSGKSGVNAGRELFAASRGKTTTS